jgi:hypothetical protein
MRAPERIAAKEAARVIAELSGKPNKYRNKPTEVDGIRFQSRLEARWWLVLRDRERCGEISELKRQVPYDLQVNGHKICRYVADYRWLDKTGTPHIADAKGALTREFIIKAKLVRALIGIEVEILK